MDRTERINKAYEYLRFHGIIKKQEDVAQKMKATRSNVSSALSGNQKVLTNSFLVRFNAAFDYIFSMDWLINGDGTMLVEDLKKQPDVVSEDEPKPFIPTWADSFFDIMTQQIKQNEALNRELRQSITALSDLTQQLTVLVSNLINK